ncbi:carbohydrate ABC transporter permease [Microbacterium sp. NPDC076768]|uniref:carbohydrate ABC transporter permease n=1 Tax=Microbacterium sp. NPDC076768 TaxID=3154858 RepID=UPI00343D66A8
MAATSVLDQNEEIAQRAREIRKARLRKKAPGMVLRYIFLFAMLIIMVGPFLWQLSTSLKGMGSDLYSLPPEFFPKDPTLDAYGRVAEVVPVWRYVLNSFIVAGGAVIGEVIGATLAGYALARLRFRGAKLALSVFLVGILIPGEVILIAKYLLTQELGLNNTLLGVILPTVVGSLNVLLMRSAFMAIPTAMDEAGMLDGANAWQRFRHIALPSVKGMMTVVAIFSFVGAWDEFLWPLIVLSDQNLYTLTVGLNFLQGTFTNDPRVVAAGTIIAIVPLIVLFFALQRYFFRGIGEGGLKG